MNDGDRRLIEAYLPKGQVSYESTREKALRRRDAHISMLHLWCDGGGGQRAPRAQRSRRR